MIKFIKENLAFISIFTIAIIVFLGPLIILRSGFISGDYMTQFYPWSKVYSESIKNFQFPFWTRYFHCGFPLMAEGQIGGFYPLNLIFFLVLPFKIAYNYSIVLHFILGGLFCYLYTKKIGAEKLGSSLSALLFCFGSAYAGCFYNIVTLKTLIWFPLVLFLMENFFESKKTEYIMLAAAISGMQFLAGFLQMAAYAFLFYLLYMLYGIRLYGIKPIRSIGIIFLFVSISSVVLLPQFLLSYQLVYLTNRAGVSADFALWGSFPPPCLLSSIFPRWMGFLGPKLYIGVLSIFFLIYAVTFLKTKISIRPVVLIGILALLLSFGKYNPLYVLLIKLSRLYSFRNPSKFLFFTTFSGSVLCGFGFSEFFRKPNKGYPKLSKHIFYIGVTISLCIFFMAKMFLLTFKDKFITILQSYTAKNIFGRPYHRYDLESYMEKAKSIYGLLLNGTDLKDIFVVLSFVMIAASLIAVSFLSVKSNRIRFSKGAAVFLIFADLYIYSFYGTGFRGNIKPFNFLVPKEKMILQILKSDKELFRILPFDITKENLPFWIRPNANILIGIDSIAAYTPLALANYKDALLSLEVVDDALGLLSPKTEALEEESEILKLLNVKYVISERRLSSRELQTLAFENNLFLYRFNGYLPRVFFVYGVEKDIKEEKTANVKVIEYRNGFAEINIDVNEEGFLVFSESYYPGWHAYIDEKETKVIRVKNLIQAVSIKKGSHKVVFKFNPKFL